MLRRRGTLVFKDATSTVFALIYATNSILPYSLGTTERGEHEEIKEKTEQIADLMMKGLLRK